MITTKKKRSKSPTARALEELRKLGYPAWVVESKVPKTIITRDFMGWADIIYVTCVSIVGVQVTTGAHHAVRKAKIIAEPRALAWINAGGLIELWSYTQKGARGEVKRWALRKEEIVREDFAP